MKRADREKTIAKMYLDPRSYVRSDDSEVLYGEDWKARKWDLWQRCGGKCENVMSEGFTNPVRCMSEAVDPHHLIRRSELRDDRLPNLQALCRFHHDSLDERKPRWTRREAILEGEGKR